MSRRSPLVGESSLVLPADRLHDPDSGDGGTSAGGASPGGMAGVMSGDGGHEVLGVPPAWMQGARRDEQQR